jgi:hypothetical protein
LRIPLIEKEKHTHHLYSIPTKDSKTNLFHTIIPESKYVALCENNRQYLKINSMEKCKYLQEETLLCSDLIPLPQENPTCKIEARDGRRRVDFICRHRHVDNTSSMSSMSTMSTLRQQYRYMSEIVICNVRLCMT